MKKRAIIFVLDGVGIGALPDAARYGDANANTIKHVAEFSSAFQVPNLERLGLGNIIPIKTISPVSQPLAAYGKMAQMAYDKDSTSGHWEIAGLKVKQQFPTYPNGFPTEIIDSFITQTKVPGILCNQPYSGTEAIKDFGEEHLKTKKPIIYTSADSVFQIAAHEEIYPVKTLYKFCEIARFQIFNQNQNIGRVIARPFRGDSANRFYRTENRKDYSIDPPRETLLDILFDQGFAVVGVGKIEDLFNYHGITQSYHSKTNQEGIDHTISFLKNMPSGLVFTNLVDFDTLWGHRNLPKEFAAGLQAFDARIPDILAAMQDDDLLFITADHGCDPTTSSTDHSREYAPLLVYGKKVIPQNLGTRGTFSDIAATIAEFLEAKAPENGISFLQSIYSKEQT